MLWLYGEVNEIAESCRYIKRRVEICFHRLIKTMISGECICMIGYCRQQCNGWNGNTDKRRFTILCLNRGGDYAAERNAFRTWIVKIGCMWLLEMSISAGVLILLLALLRSERFWHLSRRTMMLLWMVALARLLPGSLPMRKGIADPVYLHGCGRGAGCIQARCVRQMEMRLDAWRQKRLLLARRGIRGFICRRWQGLSGWNDCLWHLFCLLLS